MPISNRQAVSDLSKMGGSLGRHVSLVLEQRWV